MSESMLDEDLSSLRSVSLSDSYLLTRYESHRDTDILLTRYESPGIQMERRECLHRALRDDEVLLQIATLKLLLSCPPPGRNERHALT